MRIAEIWRYPVKSMAGESLSEAVLRIDGIVGDRVVHVQDAYERVVTARSRHRLLGHRATLGSDGEPLVDGRPWTTDSVAADIERSAGAGARLIRFDGRERFDILPLLVATDGALAAFGYDRRRLRPNLVIGGVEGLAERAWEGRRLRVGEVEIKLADLRERCIMTTVDPDTLERDVDVLRKIRRDFDGTLALNASVVRGGVLHVGDPVDLI